MPDAETPRTPEKPVKILVVDDKEGTRYTVARLLKKQHFEVVEAATGAEAIRLAATKPDLVVLDIRLPDMTGYDVCRNIKTDPETAAIPVLHLSASYADSDSRALGLEHGADGYLTHPVEARELVASINALLRTRQAERAAEERRELLRVTLASIGDAVITTDNDGRVTSLNPIAEKLCGWADGEAAGKSLVTVFAAVNEKTRQPIENLAERVLREGVIVGLANHTVLIERNGVERPIEDSAAPIRDGAGKMVGVVIVFRDVTEKRRADREIRRLLEGERRQTELLRRVAAASMTINAASGLSSVLRVITEEARSILDAHQASTFLLGENRQAAHSATAYSDKFEDYRGRVPVCEAPLLRLSKPLRRSEAELKASADWAGALEGYDRQPPLRGVLAAPLIDRKGRSMGCVRLSDKDVGDFTDEDANVLMQLAQVAAIAIENARLVEELRQADRRKDEFLAMLAHELRNPLAPIRNAIQVMNLVDTNEPRVQKARGMIERQVEHLVRLVDDLLDVSRITRGSIKLQRHRVDLSDVLTRAIEGSRPLIDARRHELAVTQAPQPLPVDADPVRLAQVFWNLLNNAAKYTPERGKISVSTELSADGQEAIVRVRDTGMGIPHEMLPKIFELFTQVERTIDRSEGGLGIGLTLVRRLTEMHGGRVEATSAGLGEGSEFLVRLPLAVNDESASRADGSKAPAKPTPAVRRILVVDDNRDSADSLATLLRLFGHDVRTAYEGRQAITVAKAYMPSVMLLDLGIPGMSGYEIANTLRALPEFASTILVALTGFGTDEDRRQTQSAGFDDHLVKPTDLATLQALLASLPNPATT